MYTGFWSLMVKCAQVIWGHAVTDFITMLLMILRSGQSSILKDGENAIPERSLNAIQVDNDISNQVQIQNNSKKVKAILKDIFELYLSGVNDLQLTDDDIVERLMSTTTNNYNGYEDVLKHALQYLNSCSFRSRKNPRNRSIKKRVNPGRISKGQRTIILKPGTKIMFKKTGSY